MTMGDRIAIINHGELQQVGTPEDVYDHPSNMFVGGFIGSPPMNFLDATVGEDGFIDFGQFKLKLLPDQVEVLKEKGLLGKEVVFGIRPEDIYDAIFAQVKVPGENMTRVRIEIIENLGGEKIAHLSAGDLTFLAKFPAESKVQEDTEVDIVFDMKKVHIFNKNTQTAVF